LKRPEARVQVKIHSSGREKEKVQKFLSEAAALGFHGRTGGVYSGIYTKKNYVFIFEEFA
jgi:hypothetical protein